MSRASALAVLLSCAVILSGCLSSGDEKEAEPATVGTTPPPASGPAAPEDPDGPAPTPNTAPTATVTADNLTGVAPLGVTFDLDGMDADGDAVTWTFDADGDGTPDAEGTDLPATAAHTYSAVGNFSALLVVSDGTDATEANLTIVVTAPSTATLPEPIAFTGTVIGAWVGAGEAGGPEYAGTGPSHTFNFTDAIPAVHNFTVTLVTASEGAIDLDFEIYAPDGSQAVRQANFNDPVDDPVDLTNPTNEEPVTVEDPTLLAMPGEWKITIRPGVAVSGEYQVAVTFA